MNREKLIANLTFWLSLGKADVMIQSHLRKNLQSIKSLHCNGRYLIFNAFNVEYGLKDRNPYGVFNYEDVYNMYTFIAAKSIMPLAVKNMLLTIQFALSSLGFKHEEIKTNFEHGVLNPALKVEDITILLGDVTESENPLEIFIRENDISFATPMADIEALVEFLKKKRLGNA